MTATTASPKRGDARKHTARELRPTPAPQPHDERSAVDIVDVWGHDSFPASDAPANW